MRDCVHVTHVMEKDELEDAQEGIL